MINFKNKKVLIWDWNGTLLNDTNYCVDCMNILLKERNIPLLDISKYKEIFTFPVQEYYKNAGFDFSKEDFSIPATEFIDHYLENLESTDIFEHSINTLDYCMSLGLKQYILSAMEHQSLIETLNARGLTKYFTDISGIGDHYARSKTESGKKLIDSIGIHESEILMIGDTVHDLEVAKELGIECLLISNGHQSKERLLKETTDVINSIAELQELFNSTSAN